MNLNQRSRRAGHTTSNDPPPHPNTVRHTCRRAAQIEELLRQFPGCQALNAERYDHRKSLFVRVHVVHNGVQDVFCTVLRCARCLPHSCDAPHHSTPPCHSSVFDLPLELKDRKTTALRITLPPHFPQARR